MPFNIKEATLGELVAEMCYLAVKFPYVLKTRDPSRIPKRQEEYYLAFRAMREEINEREKRYKLSQR